MHLELVPLLRVERELYHTPRGFARFRKYLATMQGGTNDVELLPLVALNPMGKEHVAAVLDALLALDAEAVAAEAAADAGRRLAARPARSRSGWSSPTTRRAAGRSAS